jgi:Fasciclin domain
VQAAGLLGELGDESQEFTIFAPTNDAFGELGTEEIESLLKDKALLASVRLSAGHSQWLLSACSHSAVGFMLHARTSTLPYTVRHHYTARDSSHALPPSS